MFIMHTSSYFWIMSLSYILTNLAANMSHQRIVIERIRTYTVYMIKIK